MLNMHVFHKSLFEGSQSPYFEALTAITRASLDQMKAISSDFSWQNWDEQNRENATV